MADAGTTSTPDGPGGRRRGRRLWRIVWRSAAAVVVGLFVVLVAVRLYFSDGRLRDIAYEELRTRLPASTSVELEAVEVSLWSGIEVRGLRIGVLPGFTKETFRLGRLAVHWVLWELLFLDVVVEEIALEEVFATVEENEQGRNLDHLILALQGPAPAEPVPSQPAAEPVGETPAAAPTPAKPLEPIDLPVYVEVRKLLLRDLGAEVSTPAMLARLEGLGAEGRLSGEGTALDLQLWLGLGSRDGTQRATIAFRNAAAELSVDTALGIDLRSGGLGDVGLGIRWAATAAVVEPTPLPPVDLSLSLASHADLLTQRAVVESLEVRVGRDTVLELVAAAEEFLGADPSLRVDRLSLVSRLAELAPLAAAFVPGLNLGGELNLTVEPLVAKLSQLGGADLPPARLGLRGADIGVRMEGLALDDLDLDLRAAIAEGRGEVTIALDIHRFDSAGQRVDALDLDLTAASALAPWLAGSDEGDVDATLLLRTAGAGGAAGRVSSVDLRLQTHAPAALLAGRSASAPLTIDLGLDLGRITSPSVNAEAASLGLKASVADLRGESLNAQVDLRLPGVALPLGDGSFDLGTVALRLDASRRANHFVVRDLLLTAADDFALSLRGGVDNPAGSRIGLESIVLRLTPLDITQLLSRVPEAKRPPARISGKIGLSLDADGVLPLAEILEVAKMPAAEPDADWTAQLAAYDSYLGRWAAWLGKGLPFRLELGATMLDVSYADVSNDVVGVGNDLRLSIGDRQLALRSALTVHEVRAPTPVTGVEASAALTFAAEGLRLETGVKVAKMQPAGSPVITGMETQMALSYRAGGDLLLDELAVKTQGPNLAFTSSGLIGKPVRAVVTQAWRQAGLGGLAAALRTDLRFAQADLAPPHPGAPSISGKVGVSTNVEIRDGTLLLDGQLDTEDVSMVVGETIIEDLSGSLPFRQRLAFEPREDAAVLPYDVGLGLGVLALLTSREDIRERPARPVYYSRLRRYREQQGLRIRSIVSGPYEIFDFELDAKLERATLTADHLSMRILGGDIVGNMALQLNRQRELLGDFQLKFSNLDASNFKLLALEPGAGSELSADSRVAFHFSPSERDLTLNMNVTKIGPETLDRFLQLLDPKGDDSKIQDLRGNLGLVRIDEVAVWLRFDKLYLDLSYTALLRIPGTRIGFAPIDEIPPFDLGDRLDIMVQPQIDQFLAPALGWPTARPVSSREREGER